MRYILILLPLFFISACASIIYIEDQYICDRHEQITLERSNFDKTLRLNLPDWSIELYKVEDEEGVYSNNKGIFWRENDKVAHLEVGQRLHYRACYMKRKVREIPDWQEYMLTK